MTIEQKPPELNTDPICPYCAAEFTDRKIPKRKSSFNCPSCGAKVTGAPKQYIYPSVYLTEAQAQYVNFLMSNYIGYPNATFDDYCHMVFKLWKRFGGPPGIGDVIWGLLNEFLIQCASNRMMVDAIKIVMNLFREFEKSSAAKIASKEVIPFFSPPDITPTIESAASSWSLARHELGIGKFWEAFRRICDKGEAIIILTGKKEVEDLQSDIVLMVLVSIKPPWYGLFKKITGSSPILIKIARQYNFKMRLALISGVEQISFTATPKKS
ncbi:MAG: hypothetical protein V1789_02300 [PVC group bacterium]